MSTKELHKLHLVKKAHEKFITQAKAADLLNISERQFRRLIKNYRLKGERGLVHQSRGLSSKRKFSDDFKQSIADIYRKDFSGYKPTFFTEKLHEEFNIIVSKESVRLILADHNLWIIQKKKIKHRTKRPRKQYCGELVQMDGSVHQWFDGFEGRCVLMLYIDDASSKVYARFYPYEGTIPAMDSFRRYIQRYGIPMTIYSDCHGTYKNNNKKLSIEEQLNGTAADTQFSRALNQLSVTIQHAYSPQAKGRVERNFGIFQDRLVKELKRLKITSIKQANAFLDNEFLKNYNRRFSVMPACHINLHRGALPVSKLNKILCIQEKRSVSKDFTVRFKRKILQLTHPTIARQVMVQQHCNGSLTIFHNNIQLKFKDITHKHIQSNHDDKNISNFMAIVDPITLKEVPSQYSY